MKGAIQSRQQHYVRKRWMKKLILTRSVYTTADQSLVCTHDKPAKPSSNMILNNAMFRPELSLLKNNHFWLSSYIFYRIYIWSTYVFVTQMMGLWHGISEGERGHKIGREKLHWPLLLFLIVSNISRGAGRRMRIARLHEDILVNADKMRPTKLGIVCIFADVFFLRRSACFGFLIRALANMKNGFRVIKYPQFTVYIYGLSVFPRIYRS